MNTRLYEMHSFSKNGAGGNPAGIVLECAGLTERQLQKIAYDAGFSETAFLLPSETADFQVRFFTPHEEVPLCGHATIALFSLLRQEGKITDGNYTQETKAGILKLTVSSARVMMQQTMPIFGETLEQKEIAACFDSSIETTPSMPIQIVSTGLRDIILPIKNLESLYALQLNEAGTIALCERYDAVGIHAFCKETLEHRNAAHTRNFAPRVGIREESATGTSNGALACYLFRHENDRGTDGKKDNDFVFEQGYCMGLPSEIIAQVKTPSDEIADNDIDRKDVKNCKEKKDNQGNGDIKEIWVGGTAYLAEYRSICGD